MKVFNQIISLIKPYIKTQLVGLLLTILFSMAVSASPLASKYLIDKVIPSNSYDVLWTGILIFFIICVLQPILGYLKDIALLGVSEQITLDIRNNLLKKVINAKLSYFDNAKSGEIISRIINDSREVGDLLANIFIVLLKNLLILIIALIGMFYLSFSITIIVISGLGIFFLFNILVGKRFEKISLKMQRSNDSTFSIINQIVANILTIKSLNAEDEFVKRYEKNTFDCYSNNKKMRYLSSLFNNITNVIVICSICIIYGFGSVKVMQKTLTVGDIIALALYFQTIIQPVYELINSNIQIKKIKPILDRINELSEIDQEIKDSEIDIKKIENIDIENIWFAYNNKQVLKNIKIKFPPYGVVGIIGESGSGKSTLAKLLLGFYSVDKGKLLINDIDINSVSVAELRSSISYVSQDIELFNMSIIDNIRIANPNLSEKQVIEVCNKLQLHNKIMALPEGYNTIISERINLSGGEKQRLSIARALLRNSNIFIFDEPTSALDTINESIVIDLINELSQENLVIVIAHRMSTLANADVVYKFEANNLKKVHLHKSDLLDKDA